MHHQARQPESAVSQISKLWCAHRAEHLHVSTWRRNPASAALSKILHGGPTSLRRPTHACGQRFAIVLVHSHAATGSIKRGFRNRQTVARSGAWAQSPRIFKRTRGGGGNQQHHTVLGTHGSQHSQRRPGTDAPVSSPHMVSRTLMTVSFLLFVEETDRPRGVGETWRRTRGQKLASSIYLRPWAWAAHRCLGTEPARNDASEARLRSRRTRSTRSSFLAPSSSSSLPP